MLRLLLQSLARLSFFTGSQSVFGPRGCGCVRRFLPPRVARERSSCATASCRSRQHHCKYFIRRSTRARPLLMSSLAATALNKLDVGLVGAACRGVLLECCLWVGKLPTHKQHSSKPPRHAAPTKPTPRSYTMAIQFVQCGGGQ